MDMNVTFVNARYCDIVISNWMDWLLLCRLVVVRHDIILGWNDIVSLFFCVCVHVYLNKKKKNSKQTRKKKWENWVQRLPIDEMRERELTKWNYKIVKRATKPNKYRRMQVEKPLQLYCSARIKRTKWKKKHCEIPMNIQSCIFNSI